MLSHLLGASALVLVMATIVFAVPRLAPGDPLDALVANDASAVSDPGDRARLAERYGLDQPLVAQYVDFLAGAVQGDLGWSFSRRDEVSRVLLDRLPWTVLLVVPSVLLSTLVGYAAGAAAAWAHGGWRDRILQVLFGIARSVPEFAIATGVLLLFAVRFPWFPLAGARTPFDDATGVVAVLDAMQHAALPIAALTLSLVGTKFLVARAAMLGTIDRPFLLAARAHGVAPWRVRYLRTARHAAVPLLQQVAAQVGFAVAGALFVESTFAYPGLGSLTLDAVGSRDYPLLDGCFLVLGVLTLAMTGAVDLVAGRLDPTGARR